MTAEAEGWRESNRAMWDRKAPAHLDSPVYDVAGFLAGRLSIQPHEIQDLGSVAGKDLVHLQCHIGLDTLSWARLGARVTGLDFSSASIQAARSLAQQAGLEAEFVVTDVYDAVAALGRTFDIVYTGVGALCWLPDLVRWAAVAAALLKPGGQLYLFEFHPLEWMLEQDGEGELRLRFDYFTPPGGYREGGAVAYAAAADDDAAVATVQWNHPLGEVVSALARAGLVIEELRELDRVVIDRWGGMERTADGMFRMRNSPRSPLMYVLRARRPERP